MDKPTEPIPSPDSRRSRATARAREASLRAAADAKTQTGRDENRKAAIDEALDRQARIQSGGKRREATWSNPYWLIPRVAAAAVGALLLCGIGYVIFRSSGETKPVVDPLVQTRRDLTMFQQAFSRIEWDRADRGALTPERVKEKLREPNIAKMLGRMGRDGLVDAEGRPFVFRVDNDAGTPEQYDKKPTGQVVIQLDGADPKLANLKLTLVPRWAKLSGRELQRYLAQEERHQAEMKPPESVEEATGARPENADPPTGKF